MTTPAHLLPTEQKVPHPAFFMFLIAPFGAATGFTGVCVAYLLAQAHVSAELIATMLAMNYIPQTWKFLWAPVIDLTLTRKRWFAIGMVGLVFSMLALGMQVMSTVAMPRIIALVVTLSAASTVVGMAVDCLMAHQTPEHAKGRAAGWFQAGNLGGGGLGGGAGFVADSFRRPERARRYRRVGLGLRPVQPAHFLAARGSLPGHRRQCA
ncbi:hypothetical protein WG899_18570 [Paucibacter sp. AS339]|uniref:hypothetical protein n=1 Tax=Paucibacter hankyongi TaxID=3133434 RepID=UPI0030A31BEA